MKELAWFAGCIPRPDSHCRKCSVTQLSQDDFGWFFSLEMGRAGDPGTSSYSDSQGIPGWAGPSFLRAPASAPHCQAGVVRMYTCSLHKYKTTFSFVIRGSSIVLVTCMV